jgi:hypothetical protein
MQRRQVQVWGWRTGPLPAQAAAAGAGLGRRSGCRSRRSEHQQNAGARDSWRQELTGAKFAAAGAAAAATGAGINGTQERVILGDKNWLASSLEWWFGRASAEAASISCQYNNNIRYQRRKISLSKNMNFVLWSADIQPDLCSRVSRLRRMIVCCDRYDQFQQVPCGDFPREGLTFREKDWFSERMIDLEAHRRKLRRSPANTTTMSDINGEK